MGKILAIDYGVQRVGLAITDALKITAQTMPTLEIRKDNSILLKKIEELVKNEQVDTIVIGYPKHMNGDISDTARKIDEIIPNIQKMNVNVVKWDERLTTVMAYNTMKDLGIKQKEKKKHADRLAAMYILEDYLKSLN